MRSINQLFKTNPSLIDEPEVEKLIEYCRELEDELVQLKLSDTKTMEDKLAELVRDINNSINMTLDTQENAIRFNESAEIDFESCIKNLNTYLLDFAKNNRFRL